MAVGGLAIVFGGVQNNHFENCKNVTVAMVNVQQDSMLTEDLYQQLDTISEQWHVDPVQTRQDADEALSGMKYWATKHDDIKTVYVSSYYTVDQQKIKFMVRAFLKK